MLADRDREEPRSSSLPHHRTNGSISAIRLVRAGTDKPGSALPAFPECDVIDLSATAALGHETHNQTAFACAAHGAGQHRYSGFNRDHEKIKT